MSAQALSYGNSITNTYAIRPALYVKAEALPGKVEESRWRSAASGGMSWARGKGSVPGPENTVTLFENPRENWAPSPFRRILLHQAI